MSHGLFNIMFYGSLIFVGIMFVFVIVMMISPKARAKWMGKQIEANKYMIEQQKENLKEISTNMADATKDGVKTTARAVREGLLEDDETVYCKHCGATIDSDSTFCKKCGKEQ